MFISIVIVQEVEPFDVTLVVQLSVDRLQMVETLCLHWEGKAVQWRRGGGVRGIRLASTILYNPEFFKLY